MSKIVLFVILKDYADYEAGYISLLLQAMSKGKYIVKTVSLEKNPIKSMGGFTVIPDYDIISAPKDFAGLVLIGGMSWRKEEAKAVKSLVNYAFDKDKLVAGICDAAGFLATTGILNNVNHTANDLEDIKSWAGDNYKGESKYIRKQAIRDNKIITANGTAPLEFAKEILIALNIAKQDKVEGWYNFHKLGFYNAIMPEA